jgi:CheY-like chemotaxis protein/DNA-directed RNA polymerase specialized sigma24 family protein
MSLRSDEIIHHLPDLRRYAAALVGAPRRADLLVERSLERLLAEQERVSQGHVRLALFAVLNLVHEEMLDAEVDRVDPLDGLHSGLLRLPVEERKVLLLATVAKFTHLETAALLRVSITEIGRRLLAARERLRRALSFKVLVIEDEPIIAMSIAHILARMGHEVCGVAHSRRQALARDQESRPTLILADVRLRDGDNGIATVREITQRRPVPVIFVTGHAYDLVAAKQLQPALVVGKPFSPQTLEAAVRRVVAGGGHNLM